MYVSATQPGVSNPEISISKQKTKDHSFKTAPDGRLIITDDNDGESDIEERSKKKKKASFLQNDSEDDYGKNYDKKSASCSLL